MKAGANGAVHGTATTPEFIRRWVLRTFVPSPTQRGLIEFAVRAYRIGSDDTQPAAVQLAAMARYAALIKQLGIEEACDEAQDDDETTAAEIRPFRRVV